MKLSRVTALVLTALVAAAGCADFSSDDDVDGGTILGGACQPGEGKCEGQRAMRCTDDGRGWKLDKTCAWPESCNNGACTDPCSLAKANRSYVGCEYFAVDLDNAPAEKGYSAENAQFAVVVSYAGTSEHAVGVKVYSIVKGKEAVVAQGEVQPGGVRIFKLGPRNVKGTVKGIPAYRVSAAAPVTVYQFNPLNNTLEAYSNDASLLLPVPSLDTDYIAVTGDGIMVQDADNKAKIYKMGAFVTVVGVRDGTKVTITPTAPIAAGWPQIPAGKAPITRTLNRYEVLSVASDVTGEDGGNLSGTRVHADHPVAVFAGNGATVVPTGAQQKCCADHLEQQMIPLSAWGKTFVAARTRPRKKASPEPDWWRITAGADGVKLTYQPSRPASAPDKLNKGQSASFSTTTSFVVTGSGPLLLTQFMASANHTGDITVDHPCKSDAQCTGLAFEAACSAGYCGPVGDPAMILVPPVEQFRSDYVFLVPNDYLMDYATFIAPLGATITLDGATVSQQLTAVGTVGGKPHGVVQVPLSDGKHRVSSSAPLGVLVYGLDAYVSYGYPAGMDLKRINIQ